MKSQYPSDQLLIDMLLKRDPQAFTFLYNTYSPSLHGSIIDIVAEKELATVILEDAFRMAYMTIESYDHTKKSLFIWMLHIVRRLCLETMQAMNRWPTASQLSEISGGMRSILNKMDAGQRSVITLMYYQGYTKWQVAETLDIKVEVVELLLQSGLKQLQTYINNSF